MKSETSPSPLHAVPCCPPPPPPKRTIFPHLVITRNMYRNNQTRGRRKHKQKPNEVAGRHQQRWRGLARERDACVVGGCCRNDSIGRCFLQLKTQTRVEARDSDFVMGIIGTYYPPLTSPLIFRVQVEKKFVGPTDYLHTVPSFLTYFLSSPNMRN